MRMRIDEPRRDDAVRSIDGLRGATVAAAYLDDSPARDSDIRMSARRAGAVDDKTVFDQQIVGHGYTFISPWRESDYTCFRVHCFARLFPNKTDATYSQSSFFNCFVVARSAASRLQTA